MALFFICLFNSFQLELVNMKKDKLYLIGIYIILALPLLTLPPWFSPPDWGKTIVFRIVLSLLLLLFLLQKDFSKVIKEKKPLVIWLLIALFCLFFLATILSTDITFSLFGSPYRAGGFLSLVFYFIFTFITFLVLKEKDWKRLWGFSILISVLVSLVAIIQLYGLLPSIFISFSGRPPSTIGNPIFLGMYLTMMFFPSVYLGFKDKTNKRWFYIISSLLMLYGITITGSRAAYVGLLAGIIYFALFYPRNNKKILILKIASAIAVLLGIIFVYYVNTRTEYPAFLSNNKVFRLISPRVSLDLVSADPRFSAWRVAIEAIKDRPILGYGPENFSIGFDKHYEPSLPYISKAWGGWWDRAHNILLDIAVTAGIPALIVFITFLSLLFLKLKNHIELQSALLAYFVANLFSFDTFSTYIVLFFIIGYSFSILFKEQNLKEKEINWKKPKTIILCLITLLFIWQWNIKPFNINSKINTASYLTEAKKCEQAFLIMEQVVKSHSFLDGYAQLKYADFARTCAGAGLGNEQQYAKTGVELLKKGIEIRPKYTRFWIFLGAFNNVTAEKEQDPIIKKSLIEKSFEYLEKAKTLAPKHQEIYIELAKANLVKEDYQKMKENAEYCASLDKSLGECHWMKALAELYMKDYENAIIDVQLAEENRFDTETISAMHQLINAYAKIEHYQGLKMIYEKLIKMNPDIPQYHASLAFTYANLGMYKQAKEQAILVLELQPETKQEVEKFLKSLPY